MAPIEAVWGDVFEEVHLVEAKKQAPSVIPATFKERSLHWTNQHRPRATDALSTTCLMFDMDEGDLDPIDIEDMLEHFRLGGTYWSTWSSQPGARRWRIAVPLSRPISAKVQPTLWGGWSGAFNRWLQQNVDKNRWEWVDKKAKERTQLAILPCCPPLKSRQFMKNGWGGMVPDPVHVDGDAVDPGELEAVSSIKHYRNRILCFARNRTERKTIVGVRVKRPSPYKPVGSTETARNDALGWRKNRTATPMPMASLDAVQYLRENGLGSPGGRGSALYGAIFACFRTGMALDKIKEIAKDCIDRTPGKTAKLHREARGHLQRFHSWNQKAGAWLHVAQRALFGGGHVHEEHEAAAERMLVLISRHRHLEREQGGALSFLEISKIIGLQVKVPVMWRNILTENGLLSQSGEKLERRYKLVRPEPVRNTAPVESSDVYEPPRKVKKPTLQGLDSLLHPNPDVRHPSPPDPDPEPEPVQLKKERKPPRSRFKTNSPAYRALKKVISEEFRGYEDEIPVKDGRIEPDWLRETVLLLRQMKRTKQEKFKRIRTRWVEDILLELVSLSSQ